MHLIPDPHLRTAEERCWFQVHVDDPSRINLTSGTDYNSVLPPPKPGHTWKLFQLKPITRTCDQKLPKPLPV